MPKHKVSPTYANSPIVKIITSTLQKIEYLQQKYPLLTSQNAPEHIHAYNTLQLVKSVLGNIHQSLLPQFDQYNNPGIAGLIPDLLSIRGLSNPLFGINLEKFVFTIEHPMTFELAEFIVQIAQNIPEAINTLVPFLNPEVFSTDLHSGITGTVVGKILGYTFTLKNQKNKDSSEPSYQYEYTLHQNDDVFTGSVDGTSSYHRFVKRILDKLFNKSSSFLSINKEAEYAKSHIARVGLLQNLAKVESDLVNQEITEHTQECRSDHEIHATNPLQLIQKIDHEIERNQFLLNRNQELQAQLDNRLAAYGSEPVFSLIKKYPALKQQISADKSKGLDVSYSSATMPDWVIGPDEYLLSLVRPLPIKHYLDLAVTQQQAVLNKVHEELQAKLSTLRIYREESIGIWQQETLTIYSALIKKQSTSLEVLQLNFDEVNHLSHQLPFDDNSVEVLQQIFEAKQDQVRKFEQLQQRVNLLIEDITKEAKLPIELIELDTNDIIQTAQTNQSKALIIQVKDLLKQVDLAQKTSAKQLSQLHDRKEKAESEALFAKSMTAADPKKMRDLLNETSRQVEKFTAQQQQLKEKSQSLFEQIAAVKIQIEELHLHSKEKNTRISVLNDKLYQSIDAVIDRAKKYKTLNITITTAEELISSSALCDEFIQNLLHQINHLRQENANTPEAEQYNNDCLNLLDDVSDCLQQHHNETNIDKSDIPFKEIDKLPSLQKLSQGKGFKSGFDFLLSLVGLCTKTEIKAWKNYREQQDDLLKFKPSGQMYLKYYQSLMASIKRVQEELDEQAEQERQLESISCFAAALPTVSENIHHNFMEKSNLEMEHARIELQTQNQTHLVESLQQNYEDTMQAHATAIREKELYQQDQAILNEITIIIEGIESFKRQILLLESSEEQSFSDDALYQHIAELQKTNSLLVEATKKVAETSKQSAKAQVYQENIKTINQLLESTQQSLVNTIKLKINLSPLQELLSSYQEQIISLKNTYAQLSKNFNNEQALIQLKDLNTNFNQLYIEATKQNSVIELLKAHALTIQDEQTDRRVEAIQLSYDSLQQDMDNTGNLLLGDFLSILNKLKKDAQVFKDHTFQEDNETQKLYSAQLALIRTHLSKLPSNGELPPIKSGGPKRELIKSVRKEVEEQLAQSEAINMRVLERSAERSHLVNDQLLPMLTNYWKKREESNSIKFKDTLSPADKNARFQFIEMLQTQLAQYCKTGNSEEIISTIHKNIKLYSGAHLQPILHKISVEIGDLDLKIPQNYTKDVPTELNLKKQHTQANTILKTFEEREPNYVAAIKLLYNQIDKTAELGDDAKGLANKLRTDLDRFVIAHTNKSPDEKAYYDFKNHFTSRLHSEDEVMCKHRNAWKINLANFAIGLFTLGIAIGIKLIHSKMSEGRCKFFFHETKREKQILSMEEIVHDIAAPAA